MLISKPFKKIRYNITQIFKVDKEIGQVKHKTAAYSRKHYNPLTNNRYVLTSL